MNADGAAIGAYAYPRREWGMVGQRAEVRGRKDRRLEVEKMRRQGDGSQGSEDRDRRAEALECGWRNAASAHRGMPTPRREWRMVRQRSGVRGRKDRRLEVEKMRRQGDGSQGSEDGGRRKNKMDDGRPLRWEEGRIEDQKSRRLEV